MKIALKHESDTIWLAGQLGVSERVHSSAVDLKFTGDIEIDVQGRIRALYSRLQDRKNVTSGLTFSTFLKFDTTAAAEEYAALYDTVTPRTGYVDLYGANNLAIARLDNAIVKPPTRTVNGLSLRLDYVVMGGKWLVNTGGGGDGGGGGGGGGGGDDPDFGTPEITMGGQVVTMG